MVTTRDDASQVKVLVVDDEVDSLELVMRVLGPHFSVVPAHGGREALSILEAHPDIGVVLTDLRMPEVDGIAVLRHAVTQIPDAIRIMVSAYAEPDQLLEAINQGNVHRYLLKPLQPEVLLTTVLDALSLFCWKRITEGLNQRLKILVVDDERDGIDILERALFRHFDILSAESGEEALTIIQENTDLAVVITDLRMAGMTGIKLLQQTAQRLPNAIRIMVSAYNRPEDLLDAINEGQVHHYVIKPIIPRHLVEIVKESLQSHLLINKLSTRLHPPQAKGPGSAS